MGKSILNEKSIKFLETYLNNPSPTGYEWEGQKIWMDYLKPYVDEFVTDTYGTAVGVGGSDHQIAPSKWVNIHTKKGIVKGIFGWPAIHTRTAGKEEPPKLENICIDVGAKDKKEVEKMGIHVGCVITYPDSFQILNKNMQSN